MQAIIDMLKRGIVAAGATDQSDTDLAGTANSVQIHVLFSCVKGLKSFNPFSNIEFKFYVTEGVE
jgi:hypothetical protein